MNPHHPALPPKASRPWIAAAIVVWALTDLLGSSAPIPSMEGSLEGEVTLLTDVFDGKYGQWAMGRLPHGVVLIGFPTRVSLGRGDVLTVSGELEGAPGIAAGRPYGAVLDVERVDKVKRSRFLPHRAGLVVRKRVDEALRPYDDGRGLLAGFLIGDTAHVRESDVEAMRRSGLAHFVAVSGSNVALFLGLLAVVTGPLSLGPKRRAVIGLVGLPVYVAATRFEPSVMRAAVMAGVALTGRLVGIVLEAWQLLSLAVVVLVLVDPMITSNAGFQLSVVATAGVLVGARWPVEGLVRRSLAVTIGAQIAVAPLLLVHFGSVPLLSPLVNLVAAPLVTTATMLGAVGVAGAGFLIGPASWCADLVLGLARAASGWPQLGPIGLGAVLVFALILMTAPKMRDYAVIPAAALLVVAMVVPRETLPEASVVVLDVGQGDSILINGGEGHYALVDGGPEPSVMVSKLRDYGVDDLELVVLTHVHADHANGLIGLVGIVGIHQVWAAPEPHETPASVALFDALMRHGLGWVKPEVGERWQLGRLELVVEAPLRRYASLNDQSIVLTVNGPRRTMLLTGDIETIAQADLEGLGADILKVPHHGGATSDPEWLEDAGADLAIISVGTNDFGHPADSIIETLESSGARVRRTDEDGDVVVDLGKP